MLKLGTARFWFVLAGIATGVIAFLVISNQYYQSQNKKLLEENIVRQSVNESLERTVRVQQKSQEVTDQVAQEATQRIIENNQQAEVIRGTVERRVQEIRERHETARQEQRQTRQTRRQTEAPQPSQARQSENKTTTPVNSTDASQVGSRQQEDREVSQARIDGVWASYCASVDNKDSRCNNNSQSKEVH